MWDQSLTNVCRRRIRLYRLLGQFVARSLLDSRIIDVSFNKIFLRLILGEYVPLTVTSVKVVDPVLGHSLATLQEFVELKKGIEANPNLSSEQKASSINSLDVNGVTLEDMCLDFTVPGYDDLELKANFSHVAINNTDDFLIGWRKGDYGNFE